MAAPIVIRNPILTLTKLVDGTPTGAAVDVSDDVGKVELTPTIPTTTVSTFSGKYVQADDPEWAGTASIVVNADTGTNWAPLVGFRARAALSDRGDAAGTYRQFDTEILFNPALGGPTQPGQARAFDMVLPVLSAITLVEAP